MRPIRRMDQPHFTAWEHEMLHVFLIMGKEVALIAEELQARYLTVHMPMAEGAVVAFTWEDGAVWANRRRLRRRAVGASGLARTRPAVAIASTAL
jgi:hypothetical protein